MNWFRKNAEGKFSWPGFGDNMRVLQWILERAEGKTAHETEHFFGISPAYEDLNWTGLNFTKEQYADVMTMGKAEWQSRNEAARRRVHQTQKIVCRLNSEAYRQKLGQAV